MPRADRPAKTPLYRVVGRYTTPAGSHALDVAVRARNWPAAVDLVADRAEREHGAGHFEHQAAQLLAKP